MSTIILFAEHLYWKWGFHDGDILHQALFDLGLSDKVYHRDVLAKLVEDKLLPLLPRPVKTYRIGSHNPIRVEDEHLYDGSLSVNADISVTVAYDEIRQCAEDILKEPK